MNLEQAIEILKSYYKWMSGDNKEIEYSSTISEAIDVISRELQNIINSIKCLSIDSNIPNKAKNNFQPKDGDFVKLISGCDAYEIIFRCIANNQICNYAIVDMNNDYSLSYTDNWLPSKFDMFPSDGSCIITALKHNGKRWNADKKRFEDYDTPRIGDKCIFWNNDSKAIVIDTFKKESEHDSFGKSRYLWKAEGMFFQNCVKYSNNKLIDIANKLY